MKNHKLREAIFETGLTQRDLSKKINIPESHLSMAIHGRFNLDEIQKNKIAKVLSKPITELFGD
jgi:transcriptional regulator with XRE-family HTH domain